MVVPRPGISPSAARRLFGLVAIWVAVAGVGCGGTVDQSSIRALSADPGMAVRPPSGTLVSSSDEFECRDHFDGEQPVLLRSYSVSDSREQSLASVEGELIQRGWSKVSPPGLAFTKTVGGQTARVTVSYVDGRIVIEGDVPGVDFCA